MTHAAPSRAATECCVHTLARHLRRVGSGQAHRTTSGREGRSQRFRSDNWTGVESKGLRTSEYSGGRFSKPLTACSVQLPASGSYLSTWSRSRRRASVTAAVRSGSPDASAIWCCTCCSGYMAMGSSTTRPAGPEDRIHVELNDLQYPCAHGLQCPTIDKRLQRLRRSATAQPSRRLTAHPRRPNLHTSPQGRRIHVGCWRAVVSRRSSPPVPRDCCEHPAHTTPARRYALSEF